MAMTKSNLYKHLRTGFCVIISFYAFLLTEMEWEEMDLLSDLKQLKIWGKKYTEPLPQWHLTLLFLPS